MVEGTSSTPPGGPTPPHSAPVYASASASPKSPILSAILSFFIPGLGQIINGQLKKGLILLIGYIVLWVILSVVYVIGSFATGGVGVCCCFPVLLVPLLINIYAAYDAYKTAKDINAGIFVKDWMS
jgi:TM2 domain-containing membrane protein YozV